MRTRLRTAQHGLAVVLTLGALLPVPSVLLLAGTSAVCHADDEEDQSTDVAPPELPTYDQPPIPGDGYAWTPGYWAWSDDEQDYYWVPGTWVLAPQSGYLWTPGFWSSETTVYYWHPGYWAPHVGFYGGLCYGFGYCGRGFDGAYWKGGHLFYNRLAANLGTAPIPHVYSSPVAGGGATTSFNGGTGGTTARPDAAEQTAAHENHLPLTSQQREQRAAAVREVGLRWTANQGVPPVAATARPADFSGSGVMPAKRAAGTLSIYEAPAANRPPRARGVAQSPAAAQGAAEADGPAHVRPPVDHRAPTEPRTPPEQRASVRPPERPPVVRPTPERPDPNEHRQP
jgi:hypothetical protein